MIDNINSRLKFIVQRYISDINFDDNTNIFELADIDSVTFVRILVDIETEFSVEIPPEFLFESKWNCINVMKRSLFEILSSC